MPENTTISEERLERVERKLDALLELFNVDSASPTGLKPPRRSLRQIDAIADDVVNKMKPRTSKKREGLAWP